MKMDEAMDSITKELQEYEELYDKLQKSLKKAPPGSLRANRCRGNAQFYHCTSQGNVGGQYIRKSNTELIRTLAQKEYDQKLLLYIDQRIQWLKQAINSAPDLSQEHIYTSINSLKRSYIKPYHKADEAYRKEWESLSYKGKAFHEDLPEIYTDKGERVRSKSEKIIADKLKSMGIPYRYEYPLQLKGYGTIYPDFTLLNTKTRKEYYLEHFGMMDIPEYACKAVQKLESYGRNGIFPGDKLLLTYETSDMICDMRVVQKLLEQFLL